MNEATRPVKGRGTGLSVVAFAAALVACLAFAPLASAAETPVAAGSNTTITLNKGLSKKLKKSGVKVKAISPTTVSGKTVTLPINTLSTFDPVSGQGKLLHEGGIKFKKGKKSANVTDIELITAESKMTAKVGGKVMKFASVTGVSSVRSGFGATVSISAVKLTGKAAKQLNKKLGFTAKKKKKKAKKSSASASAKKNKKKKKKAKAPFKGNQVFGKASTTPEPKTISVKAGGTVNLATSAATVKKFVQPPGTTNPETNGYGVKIEPIPPTEGAAGPSPFEPILKFPITGGSIAPNASAGLVDSAGGVNLVQDLSPTPGEARTTITLGNLSVDLQTKKAIAEVVVVSNIDPKLNLGSFGRTSIADISMTGATITSDPAAHTVTVSNATATLQETTAEVLNQVFGGPYDAMAVPHPTFAAGDPLGTFSFTATTE
jgi:hypothetical protein